MPTIEVNSKRVLAAATKKPLTGKELADKVAKKYPKEGYTGRGLGRSFSALVKEGKLEKVGSKSRPLYVKS